MFDAGMHRAIDGTPKLGLHARAVLLSCRFIGLPRFCSSQLIIGWMTDLAVHPDGKITSYAKDWYRESEMRWYMSRSSHGMLRQPIL
jgi:hypothetical protein